MRYARLTQRELQPIVEFYHSHLPAWRRFGRDTLLRECPPIAQCVTFERLSGGVYRTTAYIRVLAAPTGEWGFHLTQHLERFGNIDLRQHEQVRNRVVDAMRAEFLPPMDSPLRADTVLNLFEQMAVPSHAEVYSLAPLNAYLRHDKRALELCLQFRGLIDGLGIEWTDWLIERRSFLDQLAAWIRNGEARQQLERVLQEERNKWGLA